MPFGRKAPAAGGGGGGGGGGRGDFAWQSLASTPGTHSPAERKVAFCCAGTMKGGTTALFAYLVRHPELSLPPEKEVSERAGWRARAVLPHCCALAWRLVCVIGFGSTAQCPRWPRGALCP